MSVSDLMRNVRMLNPSELEAFLEQLRDLENEASKNDLSKKEVDLLKQINKPFTRKKSLRLNLADFRKQTLPEIVEFFNIKPLPAA